MDQRIYRAGACPLARPAGLLMQFRSSPAAFVFVPEFGEWTAFQLAALDAWRFEQKETHEKQWWDWINWQKQRGLPP